LIYTDVDGVYTTDPRVCEDARRGSGGNSQASKGGSKEFDSLMNDLPEDQARVAKDLVKRGYVSKEKYVEDYNNIPR
jgi:hypothetical protein